MSKAPAFQFYPGDWMKDPALRACSLPARGLWTDMLCLMFESQRKGYLTLNGKPVSAEQLARMVGSTVDEVSCLLAELIQSGVVSQTDTQILYSRRMVRDTELSQKRAKAGKRGGNPNLLQNKQLRERQEILLNQNASKTQAKRKQTIKQNTTPSSSSSSSISLNNNNNAREEGLLNQKQKLPDNFDKENGFPLCEYEVQERIAMCDDLMDLWNGFAEHKIKPVARMALMGEIVAAMKRYRLTWDMLVETVDNYQEAVNAPQTKAKQWSFGRWLNEGMANYRPGFYAIDNYVWEEEKAGARTRELEKLEI